MKTTVKKMFEPKEVLVFDLIGPMAHFRNNETNSTSLSYSFPPPTTLRGMIAAILGLARDSYYEILSDEHTFMVVQCLSPIRKSIHTLNYKTYSEELITQIPLEIIIPENKNEDLIYRVFVAIQDPKLQTQLETLISNNKSTYPLSFGLASFICSIKKIGKYPIIKVKNGETRKISKAILSMDQNILKIENWGQNIVIHYEKMRKNFLPGRKPDAITTLANLIEGELTIKVVNNVYDITIDNQTQTLIRY